MNTGLPIQEIDDAIPAVFLTKEPTRKEHDLAEQVGLHDGAHVPFWMFAKVCLLLQGTVAWAWHKEVIFRRFRRYSLAVASFAVLNIGAVGHYVIDRTKTNAAAEERAAAQDRSFDEYRRTMEDRITQLRQDVRELRAEIRRISGADPSPSGDMPYSPDKISFMNTESLWFVSRQ